MTGLLKYKFVISIFLMFAAGALSGALVAWPVAKRKTEGQKPTMQHACNSLKHKLESRLSLTPEQLRIISPRLDQTARELDAVHDKALDEIDRVFQRSNEDIAKELSPEQRSLLAELDKEQRRFFHQREQRGERNREAR